MKKFIAACVFASAGLLATVPVAMAQTSVPDGPAGPVFQPQAQPAAAQTPRKRKASATDIARMQRRMSMNPDQAKRDQQVEILEARAGGGNSSLSRGTTRQYESGNGGFVVRRFRDKVGTASQKRGQTRPAPGINPKGKPLKHKKAHRFLFF